MAIQSEKPRIGCRFRIRVAALTHERQSRDWQRIGRFNQFVVCLCLLPRRLWVRRAEDGEVCYRINE